MLASGSLKLLVVLMKEGNLANTGNSDSQKSNKMICLKRFFSESSDVELLTMLIVKHDLIPRLPTTF